MTTVKKNMSEIPGLLNEATAETLLRFSSDGILFLDHHGLILRVNPSAEQMFGYEEGGLTGKNVDELINGKVSDKLEEFTAEAKAALRQYCGVRKNGSGFGLEMIINPFTIGNVQLHIAFTRDVTRQLKRELMLIEQRSKIENLGRMLSEMSAEFDKRFKQRTELLSRTIAELELSKKK